MRPRLASFGPLLGLLATWVLFAALAGRSFTSWANQELMLLQTAVVGTAAVGATWIIVAGGIDLSVGANVALGTMVAAWVLRAGGGPLLASAAALAGSVLVGFVIGALVVGAIARVLAGLAAAAIVGFAARGLGVHAGLGLGLGAAALAWVALRRVRFALPLSPFIVTLGLWGALRGLAKGVGDNQPIYPPTTGWLAELMVFAHEGRAILLPPGVWILLAVAGLAALALRATVFGRHAVAIGSSEETARLCGVRIEHTKLGVYVLGTACAGIAAVLQLSYLSMGDPTAAQGLELDAIAAAVIGGASLGGGEGSIGGTLVGALIMTVVDNGCTKLGLDNWVQELVTGGIIVGAVALDRLRQRARDG